MSADPGFTRRTVLSAKEVEDIAVVLAGARRRNHVDIDCNELRDHLNHLVASAGLIEWPDHYDDGEFSKAFEEFAGDIQNPLDLKSQYLEIADLAKRLERKLRRSDLSPQLVARLRWRNAVQNGPQNPSLGPNTETFGAQKFLEFRRTLPLLQQTAQELATFESLRSRPGRPTDKLLNSLIVDLAYVYLSFRDSNTQIADLPVSPTSIFLRFCSEVLSLFFPLAATNPESLAQRWRRIRPSLREEKEE